MAAMGQDRMRHIARLRDGTLRLPPPQNDGRASIFASKTTLTYLGNAPDPSRSESHIVLAPQNLIRRRVPVRLSMQ